MEKDANYFIVGLFSLVTMLALVGFLVWVAGARDNSDKDFYTVYFTDPVTGLQPGASVQYKGVAVGQVQDIRLSTDRSDLIKVDIAVDKETPVAGGTTASLTMIGVTGMVFMNLTTDFLDKSPLQRLEGEEYPVIKGSGTQLARLLEDIPKISQRLIEMTDRINLMLSEENIESFTTISANLKALSQDLNGLLSDNNIANISTSIENFAASSDDWENMIARFSDTADKIDKTADALNQIITDNQDNINKFTTEGLDQLNATMQESRKTARTIRSTVEKLDRDPSRIIYQPSYHGVEIAK